MTIKSIAITSITGAFTVAATLVLSAAGAIASDDYPQRSIEVVHQYGPGSGTDRFIRAVAEPFADIAGRQMISVSVQGGGGIPAVTNFLRRPKDGHSMMAISPAQIISHVQGRIDMEDVLPLARVQFDQALIWVRSDSPYKTIRDFVSAAKKAPGSVSVAIYGAGGFDEVTVSLFGLETDTLMTTIPFKSAEMVSNTVGGQVDAMFEEFGPARGLWESGDLRPLIVFSEDRLPILPDVPTAVELGYDVTLGRWRAFALQAGDDAEKAQKMYDLVARAVATDSYKAFEEKSALQYRSKLIGPDAFSAFIEGEIATYGAVMKQLGLIE